MQSQLANDYYCSFVLSTASHTLSGGDAVERVGEIAIEILTL